MVNRRAGPSDHGVEEEEDHVVGDHSMEVHDMDEEDDLTVTSQGTAPTRKENNFEFTQGQSVMRLARLWITLQVMALVLDNPSTQLPIVFRIMCRGVLHYAGRFHTRPFVDLVYVFQWFLLQIKPYTDQIPAQPRALNHALPTHACARTSDTHTSHTRLPHTTQRCLSRLALAIGGPKSRAFLLPSCVRFGPRARSPQRSALSRIKFISS